MVKLKYDLNAIKSTAYDTGRVRAKVKKITKKPSSKGNPMLVFEWLILTGPDKKRRISSYPSLMENALGNLKEHLEGLGLEGKVNKSSDELIGRQAVLVLAETESNRPGGGTFVTVARVLPKSSPLNVDEEDDEDDEDLEEDDFEDEDEEWDEDEDDEEWDEDDDDEDWDDD